MNRDDIVFIVRCALAITGCLFYFIGIPMGTVICGGICLVSHLIPRQGHGEAIELSFAILRILASLIGPIFLRKYGLSYLIGCALIYCMFNLLPIVFYVFGLLFGAAVDRLLHDQEK